MAETELALADTLKRAVAAHQAGNLAEAERLYRSVLDSRSDQFDALHLLGLVRGQQGHHHEALRLIGEALRINARSASAHLNHGNVLKNLGRPDEALASYDKALAIDPDNVRALCNRGNTLRLLGRFDEALSSYDKALAVKPDFAEALYHRANARADTGRLDEALEDYRRALAIRPDYGEALLSRGNLLLHMGRVREALSDYDKAVASLPDNAEVHSNRSVALCELGRFDESLAGYDKAIALRPDYAEAYSNRGAALKALGQLDDALASLDRAIALRPDSAEAHSNRGNALKALGRFDEALACYDKAIAIKPDHADAHWNESITRLLLGDFERGWQKYEWGWKISDSRLPKREFHKPPWLGGENIAGKTVLLYAEEGLGDTIQFCRYVERTNAEGAEVILEVQSALKSLLMSVKGAKRVLGKGETLPEFDLHCPLSRLPMIFKATLATVPADIPYLAASATKVMQWKTKIGSGNGLNVGLAWSGNIRYGKLRHRSIPLRSLLSLASKDVRFFSLQKEIRVEDRAPLREAPFIVQFNEEFEDFSDTAAVVSLLDLVISIDTSVAHLAGALGKPLWLLLPFVPDWRWLLERNDSPWYPTARLFRQPKLGDWQSVIENVAGELARWCKP